METNAPMAVEVSYVFLAQRGTLHTVHRRRAPDETRAHVSDAEGVDVSVAVVSEDRDGG